MSHSGSPNEPGHVGPKITPGWLDVFRQTILFLLGVWLIWFAATTQGHDIPFLVTGLVLFGMIPFERVLNRKFRDNTSNGRDPEHPIANGLLSEDPPSD